MRVQIASFFAIVAVGLGLPPSTTAQVRQVNVATNATDTGNADDSEPSIAVNPTNPLEVVIVAFSGNWTSTTNAPVWKSSDGGLTWRRVPQIPQPQAGLAGPNDQKVAFDASGRLHVAELGSNSTTNFDFIMRQTGTADANLTAGASFGDDQPHLDIDRATLGACAGRLYSPWLNFGVARPRSTVMNSTDRGVNVTSVGAGDNSSFANRTSRIAIAPNGRVYLVYKTREGGATAEPNALENAHFRVNRSDDCGATWTGLGAGGVSVHGAGAVQTFFTVQFGNPAGGRLVARARSSDAWIAADPSDGDIYATYVRRDGSGFGQVYIARSTDQGVTWTNSRVTDGTHHSAYPEIAVAANGTVGVLFIDFDDNGTVTNFRHHFARSFDDGATWTDQMLQSMDPSGLSNARDGFLWGDYEGLTALGNTFYGVYTGQSTGRSTTQLDPIFFRDSAFSVPPKIQVASPLVFPDSCGLAPVTATLQVCNGGGAPLSVFPITSSSPRFSVATPSGGFPLSIAPGSCFPVQVTFTPTAPGPATATLTVPSDDPVNLSVSVTVRANVGQPTIATAIADTGSFGSLCPAPNRFRDLPLTINNSGSCPLTVTGLSSSSGEFELPQVLSFPIKVAPGTSVALPVRFRPTSAGTKTATIAILSDDPVTPSKAVTVSGVAPPDYVCQPPLFAAIDAGVGPTFGTGRTGNYTVTGGGRVLASFGPQRTFAVQAQGDYRFYPGRQEGQLDAGLLYRRGLLQFGFAASFADANLRAEASPGLVTDAMLSLDVLLPAFRVGVFAAKGLHETSIVGATSRVAGLPSPQAITVNERVLHTVDPIGGTVQVALLPVLWLDANVAFLNRHAPGVGNTAGGGVRVSRLLFPGIVANAQFDVNESFVGAHTVGTVTFGVTLGRWSRPSDYSNPVNPLGTYVPKVHYEIFDRVR
jgi:hypothetical protein